MKLVFYSGRMQFDGDSLLREGLGGSESALINLTTAIKKINPKIEIVVYNGHNRIKKVYDGIEYKSLIDFNIERTKFGADVFISLRSHEPFYLPYINAKKKYLWSQDDMNEPGLQELTKSFFPKESLDGIFCISNHSINSIKPAFPKTKLFLQRNGYRKDWLDQLYPMSNCVRSPIAIYSSTPFRGLDVLVEVWPAIYEGCRQKGITPELRVFGDMSLYKQQDLFTNMYQYINTKLPNARHHGSLPQSQLYNQLCYAKVMLYPNHFLETGCMAVLEALACGVWVVTTDLGALGEQVINNKNGFIIPGDSRSPEYKNKFIEYAITSLTQQVVDLDNDGLIFSWEEQAKRFLKTLEEN